MPSPKQLIVNADDFGLHRSINSAILQAHQHGIVTSASLMPGPRLAPAFDHAIELLAQMPDLDVGLHFTLVGGPGLPENALAFLQAKLMGDFPSSGIESMLRQQLDILYQKDVVVTHIDSHQHLHAIPSIMKVVASVASEYGIRAVRLPAEYGDFAGIPKKRVMLTKMVAFLCRRSKLELDRANIKYPDHFAGMAISGHLSAARLRRLITAVEPGVTEILCHPGADNISLAEEYDWGYDWLSEHIAVTDQSVAKYMKDLSISPMTFAALAPPKPYIKPEPDPGRLY